MAKIGGRKDANRHHRIAKVLAVVKDEKVSMEERNIMALRSQFPFFFKDLTDA
jgi:hypothetical protein